MNLSASISKSRKFISSSLSGSLSKGTQVISSGAEGVKTIVTFVVGTEHKPLTTAEVLRDEFHAIWEDTTPIADEKVYRNAVRKKDQAALCLSGGGIRSAAFSLGVIQAFAQQGLLTKFQYLSMVSGGGYIGAWLSRWISDVRQQNAQTVADLLGQNPKGSPKEVRQISHLRTNSNFLTPKTGITSADTWTGIMLWVRNVLLNWSIFVPALLIVVIVPNFCLAVLDAARHSQLRSATYEGHSVLLIGLAAAAAWLAFATWQVAWHLPGHRRGGALATAGVRYLIVVPVLIWSIMVPLLLATWGFPENRDYELFGYSMNILFWLLAASYAAKVTGYVLAGVTAHPRDYGLFLLNFPTWLVVSAIATAALGLAIYIIWLIAGMLPASIAMVVGRSEDSGAALIVTLCILGPLGVTLSHLLLSTLYVGFRYSGFQDDADREWLARVSAVSVFPTLLWALFAAVCLVLPWLIMDITWFHDRPTLETVAKWVTAATGAITGLIAVFGGQSASTKLDLVATAPEKKKALPFEILVKVATLLFIALLFICVARVERIAANALVNLLWQSSSEIATTLRLYLPRLFVFLALFVVILAVWWLINAKRIYLIGATVILAILTLLLGYWSGGLNAWLWKHAADATQIIIAHGLVALALIFLIVVTSNKIDVNRYSLHGIYRNRLVRAFLGGAREQRTPNKFTLFDPADNRRMHELQAQLNGKRVLFPVINVTLNLVGGENLAWQERKASSFIITPLACGSGTLRRVDTSSAPPNSPPLWIGAYVKSEDYGGTERDLSRAPAGAPAAGAAGAADGANPAAPSPTGISLGTAMTISGAAVSPSQGYNSSPATAFLLTLFNVRLGAWLANPAADLKLETKRDGPTNALMPLMIEALGLTNDKRDNVYLSDGGHFDNLGLYEMVRRRCRFIFVVDAEADKEFAFEDFGKAVRQVVIDLDADIEFKSIKMKTARVANEKSPTFAIGRIKYGEGGDPGWIIYLKPTFFYETAPVDVRSYGTVNGDFPHESTLDQWFAESQFESYRRLGHYLTKKLCAKRKGTGPFADMAEFFTAVAGQRIKPRPKT